VSRLCPDPLGSPREGREERRIEGERERWLHYTLYQVYSGVSSMQRSGEAKLRGSGGWKSP